MKNFSKINRAFVAKKKFFLFSLLVAATSLFAETKVETFTPKSGTGTTKTYVSAAETVECDQASWTVLLGGVYKNLGAMGSDNFAAVLRAKKDGETDYAYLQSSTIEGGIDSLWFTWNSNGSEAGQNWDIKIYVNDKMVGNITEPGAAQIAAAPFNTFAVGNIGVTGEFTIKIVNESPYTGSSNKLRFVLDDLSWSPKAVAGEKTTPQVKFAAEEILMKVNEAGFSNLLITNSDATPVYESSNVEVATVAADGQVTIVGAGTTTITVSLAETATYKAATASYTLRVVPMTFNMETFEGALNAEANNTYLATPTASFAPSTATGITWTTYLGSVRGTLGGNGADNMAAVIRGRKPAEVEANSDYAYLLSSTIQGGIDSLAFEWNSNGDESSRKNPWNIEIYVNDQLVGKITDKCTTKQAAGNEFKYGVGGLKVAGEFTIKVVNKNDADGNSNHYRFVMDNLEWYSYEAQGPGTGIEDTPAMHDVRKQILNGQLVIIVDGVRYNSLGQTL